MEQKRRESGQSIIIIVFIVMVILALLALVVDIGNAYAQRRVVQNAVDAAAMACAVKLSEQGPLVDGARNPAVTDDQVNRVMREYAANNGMDPNEVEGWYVDEAGQPFATKIGNWGFGIDVPADARGVTLAGELTTATYFAHLLGIEEITVEAPGAAYVLTGPCTGNELFPASVNMDSFPNGQPEVGTEYTMMGGSPNRANDDFWWVFWDPNGSSLPTVSGVPKQQQDSNAALGENMVYPVRSGQWRVGDWVPRSSGVQFTQEEQCIIGARIAGTSYNDTNIYGCKKNDPYIPLQPEVTIPIHDAYDSQGQDSYRIAGFARFHLTCYYASTNNFIGGCEDCINQGAPNQCLQGYFVEWVAEPFEDGCIDTGITAPSYRMPTQP